MARITQTGLGKGVSDPLGPGGGDVDLDAETTKINALPLDAAPDSAVDLVMTYDDSAAAHKSVLLSDLSGAMLSGTAPLNPIKIRDPGVGAAAARDDHRHEPPGTEFSWLHDDFFGSAFLAIWAFVTSGAGSSIVIDETFAGGVAAVTTGGGAGNFASLQFRVGGAVQIQFLASLNVILRLRFRLTNLNETEYFLGFFDVLENFDNYATLRIPRSAAGVAVLESNQGGGGATLTPTSFTAAINTWYDYELRVSPSLIEAFINGASIGSHTVNIPTLKLYPDLFAGKVSGTGGAATLFLDYAQFRQDHES